mmetsp:Transcript_36922/g.42958  ORF Transcript_36922/g.42958 Transcript_36922/m.42958 type:complete len:611 (+) Transcript_36922:34-1866(+)
MKFITRIPAWLGIISATTQLINITAFQSNTCFIRSYHPLIARERRKTLYARNNSKSRRQPTEEASTPSIIEITSSTPEASTPTIESPPPAEPKKRKRRKSRSGLVDNDEFFPTYYEKLNSPTNATKTQLRKQYVVLMKQTHPDAIRNLTPEQQPQHTYQQVVNAYNVLSNAKDRRKYDRTLKARLFQRQVEEAASKAADAAAPRIAKVFEDFALPMLRRTSAITAAAAAAASTKKAPAAEPERLKGVGRVVSNAVKAGIGASRDLDQLEVLEQSKTLEQRSNDLGGSEEDVKKRLEKVSMERLMMQLRVSEGASPFSSREASDLLGRLEKEAALATGGVLDVDLDMIKEVIEEQSTTTSSVLDALLFFKHSVTQDIDALERVEEDYFSRKVALDKAGEDSDRKEADQTQAENNAKAALEAEKRAREALEFAQKLVASTSLDITQSQKQYHTAKQTQKKLMHEIEKTSAHLAKKQETVREGLRRKLEFIEKQKKSSEKERAQSEVVTVLEIKEDEGDGITILDNEGDDITFVEEEGDGITILDDEDEDTSATIAASSITFLADDSLSQLDQIRKEEMFLSQELRAIRTKRKKLDSEAQSLKDRVSQSVREQ